MQDTRSLQCQLTSWCYYQATGLMVEQKLQVVKSLVSNKNKGPCTSVFDHRLVLGEENNKNIKMVCV